MDQAFDAGLEFDEGAEVGDAGDGAVGAIARLECVGDGVPWMREELLQADGAARLAAFVRHLEDFGFDVQADGDRVGRLGDSGPTDVGDVEQGIDAADVDESSVVGEAADGAADGIAFLDFGEATVFVEASSSSSTMRRSTTKSSSAASSLVMRQRISWPTSFSISAALRVPVREAGRKARTPTSQSGRL